MAKRAAQKTSKPSETPREADEHGVVRRGVWPLDDIKEYPHNPKTHPPAQIELLAKLLKKYGPDQDIVVDENGEILKGHGRKLAAKMAELDGFPVTQRYGMSETDKRAMRIEDNSIPLLGSWDDKLMKFEIESLRRAGYDMKLLGFGDKQLVQFETTIAPPSAFPTHDESIPTEFCCPRCSYQWSGKPKPDPKDHDLKPVAAAASSRKKA